ncbi:MAG: hypothetical protein HZC40_13165 [Chloroflexi bacterium]|nr:hypothetical protein [Chloroflexota bacterium]
MNPHEITRYPITIDGDTTRIGTAHELAIALDVLQGQHDRAVLEQLRAHLAEIVNTPHGFARVLTALAPDDQIFLNDAIGARLAATLQDARHLRDIFAAMSVIAVEQKLLDTLGTNGLRALIHTAEELAEILEWLYGECDRQAIELIGIAHLKQVIRHASDLCLVLHALDANGKRDLIERIGWANVVHLVRDGIDLAHLARTISSELTARLIAEFTREQMLALIGNARDWQYLWARLEGAERLMIATKLGAHYAA